MNVKAHEATGHVTMHGHAMKLHSAVNRAIQDDARFNIPPQDAANLCYKPKPYVVDIITPDENGNHFAVISTARGELLRHGFEYNTEDGAVKLADGESSKTESTHVYSRECEKFDALIKAHSSDFIQCRASSGVKLSAKEVWESGKPVSFIYAPGGTTTINAGFRKGESITCCVQIDEDTAKDLQDSFDFVCATEKQEPYSDEDHEAKKATLRFPKGQVNFTYGTIRGEEGIIVSGAEPTSYGAEAVNGKVYASWSPEFATDANYEKAKCKKGHWTFPDGVRGSASNPARMVAISFVTGALTNKPAFKNMPNVKAKKVENEVEKAPSIGSLINFISLVKIAHFNADTKTNDHESLGELYDDLADLADSFAETFCGAFGVKVENEPVDMAASSDFTAILDKGTEIVAALRVACEGKEDLLNLLADMDKALNHSRFLLKATDQVEGETVKAGDFPGHPFRGNQHMSGHGSGPHHSASRKAHFSSKKAKDKKSHEEAAAHHEKAAKSWSKQDDGDEASDYHTTMSEFHKRAALKKEKKAAVKTTEAPTEDLIIKAFFAKTEAEKAIAHQFTKRIPGIDTRETVAQFLARSGKNG